MSKKIYLASPYGFSPQQEERLLPTFVGILSELGADVWEPFARNKQSVDFLSLNTMIFSGLPERGWEDYFYRSVD